MITRAQVLAMFSAAVVTTVSALSVALAQGAGQATAATDEAKASSTETGSLVCDRVEGTTRNLIVTSKTDVRCIFSGRDGAQQWYKGETGVGLGLDLKWNKEQTTRYAVLSSTTAFTPESDFLTGNYAGAKAEASLGVGVGAALLVGGSDSTTSLQPAIETSTGVGVAAGVSYLNVTSDPLNDARMVTVANDYYGQALYAEYFSTAYGFRGKKLYDASDEFSHRAVAAATGAVPEPLAIGGLDTERKRVVDALANPERAKVPAQAAGAQSAYDCWAYGVAAKWPEAQVATCRTEFLSRMASLESRLAAEERASDAVMELSLARWFYIYFPVDGQAVNTNGLDTVSEVRAMLSNLLEAKIYVQGYTDKSGTVRYNDALSLRRAEAVRSELARAGVPDAWIAADGIGPRDPLSVSNNPHNALSRRVEVVVVPQSIDPRAIERARSN